MPMPYPLSVASRSWSQSPQGLLVPPPRAIETTSPPSARGVEPVQGYRVTFALDMSDPRDRALHARQFDVMLAMLTSINVGYLAAHPEVQPLATLLKSGRVRYEAEPPGQEEWQDAAITLARGAGDAEDLACWAAAEESLRQRRFTPPTLRAGEPEEFGSGRFTCVLDLFQGNRERNLSRRALSIMLDALYKIDCLYLQRHPETPSVYAARPLYMEEPVGQEEWQDASTCIRMGIADCEDLACWRAAELTVKHGVRARPDWKEFPRENGSYLYHIITRWPNGHEEDPSKILGMR